MQTIAVVLLFAVGFLLGALCCVALQSPVWR